MWKKYKQFLEWYREPEQQKIVYKYRKWFWVVLLAASIPTGLISSTVFVSVLSIWALYLTDSAGEQAADGAVEAKSNGS